MNVYILGIGGTFMGGLALLARSCGHEVSGADSGIYPPMSTQLHAHGIAYVDSYDIQHLRTAQPDCVIIGNALSRGNAAVEYVLDSGLTYMSGPQWLAQNILQRQHVLAVAGTHGKTTTTAMLAWILECAGLNPSFLIGGVARNFELSARLSHSPYFVIEADEYDSAFFDKRSKFLHYQARTLILNNLEYDHADIFPDLAAIQRQFHYLLRTVPARGRIIYNANDTALTQAIAQGCWSQQVSFGVGGTWYAQVLTPDHSAFEVYCQDRKVGAVHWSLMGAHNSANALAALAASAHIGISPHHACAALGRFESVKRRLEIRGHVGGITVYDDFAHHPTAIRTTLEGLRLHLGNNQRIIAVLEPRSNTMRLGVHKDTLIPALAAADFSLIYQPPTLSWQLPSSDRVHIFDNIDAILNTLKTLLQPGDHVLIMSNGGFDKLHTRVLEQLQT
jgi:UDP-N-acetylmuramate: L-alanyl-gamma-D-glutamyl-meso-diaminopimelate ligase